MVGEAPTTARDAWAPHATASFRLRLPRRRSRRRGRWRRRRLHRCRHGRLRARHGHPRTCYLDHGLQLRHGLVTGCHGRVPMSLKVIGGTLQLSLRLLQCHDRPLIHKRARSTKLSRRRKPWPSRKWLGSGRPAGVRSRAGLHHGRNRRRRRRRRIVLCPQIIPRKGQRTRTSQTGKYRHFSFHSSHSLLKGWPDPNSSPANRKAPKIPPQWLGSICTKTSCTVGTVSLTLFLTRWAM